MQTICERGTFNDQAILRLNIDGVRVAQEVLVKISSDTLTLCQSRVVECRLWTRVTFDSNLRVETESWIAVAFIFSVRAIGPRSRKFSPSQGIPYEFVTLDSLRKTDAPGDHRKTRLELAHTISLWTGSHGRILGNTGKW